MRYDLTDFEWSVIEPLLPTGLPGPRKVNDRRFLHGIFWVLHSGGPDLPERYGQTHRYPCLVAINSVHGLVNRQRA